VASIAQKFDQIPLARIGEHLDDDLSSLHQLLGQVNQELVPNATQTVAQARDTLSTLQELLAHDSPLQHKLDQTLEDTDATMQELRSLADFLQRHPESLLRGRPADTKGNTKPPWRASLSSEHRFWASQDLRDVRAQRFICIPSHQRPPRRLQQSNRRLHRRGL
jgi:paraquat-inducible protein B